MLTLLFGRPEWSFSPFLLEPGSCSRKHRERIYGSEHRRPSRHTKTTRSSLCWHPERSKDGKMTHTGQSKIHTKAYLHHFLSPLVATLDDKSVNLVRRLKILFQTHLVFASLVLTPLKDLLFDWSSRSWSRCWPLNLEVAGHCCPEIDVTIEHIFLYQVRYYSH